MSRAPSQFDSSKHREVGKIYRDKTFSEKVGDFFIGLFIVAAIIGAIAFFAS
jgi:hypothetical protein|tara:strand:- start:1403 stop:1558 length:156 start_codon:yes stop_codon:yes gene_type:complete